MIEAERELCVAVDRIQFTPPVAHVYNPLDYARRAHEAYLRKFANSHKRVVFLGMNPGPFGMVQTGVPFGEISAVRVWMQIAASVGEPRRKHPKRPVEGFACPRSEVSGKRLWGLFADRFGSAENFFADHFVINYCPLAFFDKDGRNLTPDKLSASQAAPLFAACDRHLHRAVEILRPEWLIGIGGFAEKRARLLLAEVAVNKNPPLTPPKRGTEPPRRLSGSPPWEGPGVGLSALGSRKILSLQPSLGEAVGRRTPSQMPVLKIGRILHPSPASPAANKDWARKAAAALKALGIWK
jgi:single-strand selective monofunctional uracil DNA glycosylase